MLRSQLNALRSVSVDASKRRTQWSAHEVTMSVMSHENCMSEMRLPCTPSTIPFCSPVSGFHTLSVVSSLAEKIERLTGPHSARGILPVWPRMVTFGQSGWLARLLSSRSHTKMVGTLPMILSSTVRNCLSPSANRTSRTGAVCFHVCRHSPVSTFHSLHILSALPVSTCVLLKLTSMHQTVPLCPSKVPIRSPLSAYHMLGVWSFAVVKSRSPSRLYFTMVSGRV
mmetsp:Transcript_14281/g.37054  ORF Transcript_14281/g.37054 Transcript_14281/m.37054 type:complete len:226 (-) Transcript_14281:137-814(-)